MDYDKNFRLWLSSLAIGMMLGVAFGLGHHFGISEGKQRAKAALKQEMDSAYATLVRDYERREGDSLHADVVFVLGENDSAKSRVLRHELDWFQRYLARRLAQVE